MILRNVGEKEASNSCLLTGERDWNRFNFFFAKYKILYGALHFKKLPSSLMKYYFVFDFNMLL